MADEQKRIRKHILTEQQTKWLVKHYAHTKNAEIMKRFGLTNSSLHRIVRELGLKKSTQFVHKCQRAASEAGAAACYRNGYYDYLRKHPFNDTKNGFQKGVTNEQRLGKKRNRERIEKAAASLRKTRASERRRLIFGFEQQTKLRIIFTPQNRAKYNFKWRLRKLGYYVERFGYDVFYDSSTRRSARVEQTGRERYRFDFIEREDEDNVKLSKNKENE